MHLAAPGWFGGVVWTTLGASDDHLRTLSALHHEKFARSCRYDTITEPHLYWYGCTTPIAPNFSTLAQKSGFAKFYKCFTPP